MEGCPKSPEPEFVGLKFIYKECINKLNKLYEEYSKYIPEDIKNIYPKTELKPTDQCYLKIQSISQACTKEILKLVARYQELLILITKIPLNADSKAPKTLREYLSTILRGADWQNITQQSQNISNLITHRTKADNNDYDNISNLLKNTKQFLESFENIKAKLESGIKYKINEDKNLEITLQIEDKPEVITLSLNNLKQRFEGILQIYNADNNESSNQNTFGMIISTKQQILEIINTIQSNLKNLDTENSGISNQIEKLKNKIWILKEFCLQKSPLRNMLAEYLGSLEFLKDINYDTSSVDDHVSCYFDSTDNDLIFRSTQIKIMLNKDIQNNIDLIKQAIKFIDSLNKGEVVDISPLIKPFMESTAIDLLD